MYHQLAHRIEAHLFIAFLAYCLSITLRMHLKARAGGLMPRTVFEKMATMQLLDVIVPTTDGRELRMVRRSEPDKDMRLLLDLLKLELPAQLPSKIHNSEKTPMQRRPLSQMPANQNTLISKTCE